MKLRVLSVVALLFSVLPLAQPAFGGAADVVVSAGTPFYESPDFKSKMLGVAASDSSAEVLESRRMYCDNPSLPPDKYHPLIAAAVFHKVARGESSRAWVCENVRYDPAVGKPSYMCLPWDVMKIPFLLSTGGLLLALFLGCRRDGPLLGLLARDAPLSGGAVFLPLAAALLLRLAILSLFLFLHGGVVLRPTDELGYFEVARDILNLYPPDKWGYTIGLPMLYIPFMAVFGSESYSDILLPFSLFACFVLAPATLVLSYYLILRVSGSARAAFLTVLVLAFLPFVYFPLEAHGGDGVFKAGFFLPDVTSGSYRFYYASIFAGFSGFSDAFSTLLVLSCASLCFWMRPGARMLAVASAVFALACVTRINNIYFAPLLGYLFWTRMRPELSDWRRLCQNALFAAGVFTLAFSPQLLANQLNLGAPWLFPYELHVSAAAKGFEFSVLPRGLRFIIGCNYLYVCAAVASFAFMKKDVRFVLLILWAVPTILFFCGYFCNVAGPIRFILSAYPALLAALFSLDVFCGVGKVRLLAALGILLANVLLVIPCGWSTPHLAFDLDLADWGTDFARWLNVLLPLASFPALAVLLWRFKRARNFSILFLALFSLGSPWILFYLMVWFLCVALLVAGRDVFSSLASSLKSDAGDGRA